MSQKQPGGLVPRSSVVAVVSRDIAVLVVLSACGGKTAPPAPPPQAATPAHAVTAVVLANGCAGLGADNAKLAQSAMNQLVDGCGDFTGGRVRFSARLLPGGAIQFVQGPDPAQAIPVCVLTHPLTHRVRLQSACTLDVQLEEGSVDVPKGSGGP